MKPTFGHSSGIVSDISRIDAGYLGCRCSEQRVCCSKVVHVDMVVKWPLWDLQMSMFWMDAEMDGCEDRANSVLLVMEPFVEVAMEELLAPALIVIGMENSLMEQNEYL